MCDLSPDQRGHVGVDTDECDGAIDESEVDVPARRQPSLQVRAHSQFDEPIVEAVARIKAVLKNEGLIANDYVRPPQQGIGGAEKTELLKRYAALRARTGAHLAAVGA